MVEAGITKELASVERVALMHYGTKSREDFEVKVARGPGGHGGAKKLDYFERLAQCVSLLLAT